MQLEQKMCREQQSCTQRRLQSNLVYGSPEGCIGFYSKWEKNRKTSAQGFDFRKENKQLKGHLKFSHTSFA
ncbi:unnamed protein product [Caretta caretta]